MKFVYPEFLYALFALLIPVIIHLFNFRRFKRIQFSNVKFLSEVKLETQSKSRLKHLLVLFSRLLALASLVLAFCLPYMPVADQQMKAGRKAVSVYIDNSFSMNGENENGILLEQAKEMARNVARSHDESDRFQLLTNDFEGRHQRMVSREEFIEYVDEVKTSAKTKSLSKVVERMKEALNREGIDNKKGFVLSDLQKTITDVGSIRVDSSYSFNIIPVQQNELSNIYIDSIWFKTPVRQLNNNEELIVKIVNNGDREINSLGINLKIDNQQKALATVDIPANSSATASLFFTNDKSGIMDGVVSIKDHPITFDDQFYFSYDVTNKIKVLNIGANSGSVKSVFTGDEFYEYTEFSINSVDYSVFGDKDLIVLDGLEKISTGLNQELKKFALHGGSIVVLPSQQLKRTSYNEFLLNMNANRIATISNKVTSVKDINLENYFFEGVFAQKPNNIDLPAVKIHLTFNGRSQSREEVLLGLRDGSSFLSRYPVGNGQLYVFAVGTSLDMSNLSRHAIFVTSMLRIAELSNGTQQLYQVIGEDQAIEVNISEMQQEETFHLQKSDSQFDVIPSFQNFGEGIKVFVHQQIKEDGNYVLSKGSADITGVAFNYSRKESDLSFFSSEALDKELQISGLSNFKILETINGTELSLNEITDGTKLWKWFVLMAIIFLLIEVLLLRFL